MKSQRKKALVHANCNNLLKSVYNINHFQFSSLSKAVILNIFFLTYLLESQYGALSCKITSTLYCNTTCSHCLQAIIKKKNSYLTFRNTSKILQITNRNTKCKTQRKKYMSIWHFKLSFCYGLNGIPSKKICWIPNPLCLRMLLFGNGVITKGGR